MAYQSKEQSQQGGSRVPELGGSHPVKIRSIEYREDPLKQGGESKPRVQASIEIIDPAGEREYSPIQASWFLPDFPSEGKEIQGRLVGPGELFSWSAKRFNTSVMNQLLMNFIHRGKIGSPESQRFNDYMKNYGSGKTEETPLIDTMEKLIEDVKLQVEAIQDSLRNHKKTLYGFFVFKAAKNGDNYVHRLNLFIPRDNDLPKQNGYSTASYFPCINWKNHEDATKADGSPLVPDNILERTVKGWDVTPPVEDAGW